MQDAIKFETANGAKVTVTADSGTLRATAEGDGYGFETSARLDTHRGMDVLNCGTQRDDDGKKFVAAIPVDGHKADIEQLREDSKSDESLAYQAVEQTKTIRSDWGNKEVTELRLSANKSITEMDDDETELYLKIDSERDVPDDAEAGDVLTPEDILGDTRTDEEKDQDALAEAAETGEEVTAKSWTEDCSDAGRECSLDRVSRVATPDGEIETRRTHTY